MCFAPRDDMLTRMPTRPSTQFVNRELQVSFLHKTIICLEIYVPHVVESVIITRTDKQTDDGEVIAKCQPDLHVWKSG